MSSYMNFFVKYNDVYAPIGSFSRNNTIYQVFDRLYGKIQPLTKNELEMVRNTINTRKNELKEYEKNYDNTIKIIQNMNNSVDDKLLALSELANERKDLDFEIDDVIMAENFCNFLETILDETYNEDYGLDRDNYIYYGVEVSNPNEEE